MSKPLQGPITQLQALFACVGTILGVLITVYSAVNSAIEHQVHTEVTVQSAAQVKLLRDEVEAMTATFASTSDVLHMKEMNQQNWNTVQQQLSVIQVQVEQLNSTMLQRNSRMLNPNARGHGIAPNQIAESRLP